MRWRPPHHGDRRVVRRFLFLPKTLQRRLASHNLSSDWERRWLCWATWTQRYRVTEHSKNARRSWEDECWERDSCPRTYNPGPAVSSYRP